MDRHITLQEIDNLRDYGGYATACGRGLRRASLYRSANHHRATDADLEALACLGIAVVVDLRRSNEREREPSRRWAGFEAEVICNDIGDADDGWEALLTRGEPTEEFFRASSREWYRRALFEPRHVDLYSRYFAALAGSDAPVLIHCAAGKDRTGLLAALTHHAAGVGRDDMVADFLLTNQVTIRPARMERIGALIARLSGHVPTDAAVRTAMSVYAEDLESALDAASERYGSLDAYLETALGFTAARRDAFERHRLGVGV